MSMIRLTETTSGDLPQLREWVAADNWHRDNPLNVPELMLTGNGLLSFCLQDDKGPLCYVKLTNAKELARISIQFGPESEVSKRRLVVGLATTGIPAMAIFAKEQGYKGLVFESINPALIGFGSKFGFKAVGGDDYALIFETNECLEK